MTIDYFLSLVLVFAPNLGLFVWFRAAKRRTIKNEETLTFAVALLAAVGFVGAAFLSKSMLPQHSIFPELFSSLGVAVAQTIWFTVGRRSRGD